MKKFIFILVVLIFMGAGCENIENKTDIKRPTSNNFSDREETPVITVEKDNVDSIQVEEFYNGSDGFSLSVSTGNESICVWTYVGGTGRVSYMETTHANSATEKHFITFPNGKGSLYNFKVICTDDFGNNYTGIFPEN